MYKNTVVFENEPLTNCAVSRCSVAKSPKPKFKPAGDHDHSARNISRRVIVAGDEQIAHDGTKSEFEQFFAGLSRQAIFWSFRAIPDQSAARAAWSEINTPEPIELVVFETVL